MIAFSTGQIRRSAPVAALLFAAILTTGCSSLSIPAFKPPAPDVPYQPIGEGVTLAGTATQDMYQRVRQAKRENAIVLEVVGDEQPTRVLPLPPGQKSVFVSTLLQQTGVLAKIGAVDATLYRYTSDSVSGIPMAVKMSEDGDQVRPESDYALRAGDRLQVSERKFDSLNSLMEMVGLL
ncbi:MULTISPECIES: hypothetical protein [Crateriforma]|uniref:Uncharacterized protein n=1 Tax=Crateriforma conspicua TaxID=2527996 RepID=A0A5C6FQX1_9PLAN|nr:MULTISPECIES: hypothetical protein [Crateriforma]TWU64751.1 hypothetical protein V7x_02950 [Crateriforma conspicua]